MSSNLSTKHWITLGVVSIPVLGYFLLLLAHFVNIPFNDDYDLILGLVNQFEHLTAWQRWEAIFRQANEHRITIVKLVVLAWFYIVGSVDLRGFMIIGSLALPVLVWFLWKEELKKGFSWWYVLPVTLFLFQPQYYQASFWGIDSMQTFFVILFAYLTLYYVYKAHWGYLVLALFFAVCATFSMGNGLIAFVLALAILVYQKRWLHLSIWLGILVAVLLLYFLTYESLPHHPSLIDAIVDHPWMTIQYFLTFVGASINFTNGTSMAIGLVLVGFFLFLTFKQYFKTHTVLYAFILFILASAAVTSLARSGFGIEQALSSRYKVYPALFLVMAYMGFMTYFNKATAKKLLPYFIAFAAIFNIGCYMVYYPQVLEHKEKLYTGLLTYGSNEPALEYALQDRANKIIEESLTKGYWSLPDIPPSFFNRLTGNSLPDVYEEGIAVHATSYKESHLMFTVNGCARIIESRTFGDPVWVVLQGNGEVYVFEADFNAQSSATCGTRFVCKIEKARLRPGIYQVALYMKSKHTLPMVADVTQLIQITSSPVSLEHQVTLQQLTDSTYNLKGWVQDSIMSGTGHKVLVTLRSDKNSIMAEGQRYQHNPYNADGTFTTDIWDNRNGWYDDLGLEGVNFSYDFRFMVKEPHEIDEEDPGSGINGMYNQRFAFFPELVGEARRSTGLSIGTNGISIYEHVANYFNARLVYEGELIGWHHAAIVYKNNAPHLYLDGQLVASKSPSLHPVIPFFSLGFLYSNNKPFTGSIDDLRIWDRALTTEEVQNIANQPLDPKTPGLVLYYDFNTIRHESDSIPDLTGHGHTGVIDYNRKRQLFEFTTNLNLSGLEPGHYQIGLTLMNQEGDIMAAQTGREIIYSK